MKCNTKPLIIKMFEAGFFLLSQFLIHCFENAPYSCRIQTTIYKLLTKSNMKSFNSPCFRLLHSFYVREVLPKLLWCTKCLYCYVKRVKVLPFDIYMYVKDIVQISGIFRTLQARTKRQCPNNSFMYMYV